MSASDRQVAELRAWAGRIRRAEERGLLGRLRIVRRAASAPPSFLRAAWRTLAEYGAEVANRYGVTRVSQLQGMLECRLRWGLDPIAYYRFRLYLGDRKRRAAQYVQTADVRVTLDWLVHATPGYPAVFRDKRDFELWCGEHRLPSVSAVAVFVNGTVVRGEPLALPPGDLFSKPSNWQSGRGAERWKFDERGGGWLDTAGRLHNGERLFARLASESLALERPMLLQRLLRNHASLAAIAGGRLCTARVLTARAPRERARLLLAVYRMPAASTIADNFDLGGIAAPIEITTGRLGAGIRKYPRVVGPMERHPDTGAAFTGLHIPWWPEVVQLVLRAHDAVEWQGVPVLGWDVAVLDDGPVLLEGNNLPCATLAQMPSGVPLGATPFVTCVNAHLRERWEAPGAASADCGSRMAQREAIASPEAPPPAACR